MKVSGTLHEMGLNPKAGTSTASAVNTRGSDEAMAAAMEPTAWNSTFVVKRLPSSRMYDAVSLVSRSSSSFRFLWKVMPKMHVLEPSMRWKRSLNERHAPVSESCRQNSIVAMPMMLM